MGLRADAPVFTPGAVAVDAGVHLARGDRLIQELAAALPCPASASRPERPVSMLPADGIFCPYCIAGMACAFHKAAGTQTLRKVEVCKPVGAPGLTRMQPAAPTLADIGLGCNPSILDSKALFQAECAFGSCVADVEKMLLDATSEASTDVSGSEAWCAASDTSEPSPTPPGISRGSVITDPCELLCGPKPHTSLHHANNELRAGGTRWGGVARTGPNGAHHKARMFAR